MHPDIPPWAYVVADWLPLFVLLALLLTAAVTWLLCGERARRLAAVVARQDTHIRDLERQLADAHAVKGAHYRDKETLDE